MKYISYKGGAMIINNDSKIMFIDSKKIPLQAKGDYQLLEIIIRENE